MANAPVVCRWGRGWLGAAPWGWEAEAAAASPDSGNLAVAGRAVKVRSQNPTSELPTASGVCEGMGVQAPRRRAAAERHRQVRDGVVREPAPEAARSRRLPWPRRGPGCRGVKSRGAPGSAPSCYREPREGFRVAHAQHRSRPQRQPLRKAEGGSAGDQVRAAGTWEAAGWGVESGAGPPPCLCQGPSPRDSSSRFCSRCCYPTIQALSAVLKSGRLGVPALLLTDGV